VLTALNDNIVFFYSPTQVAEKKPGPSGAFAWAAWSSRAA
jgi:cytochrome c-type biogenesis protein CcmE